MENNDMKTGPKHQAKPDDARPQMRRFYKEVTVSKEASGHAIELDGRSIRTPMKNTLLLPNLSMAEAIAKEWQAQEEFILHEKMIKTKLANTAIDRVAGRSGEIIDEIIAYLASDLLLYRATEPESLIEREKALWDPYLTWLRDENRITLTSTSGIIHVTQEQSELEKFKTLISDETPFSLTALHNMTTLTGSAILALALARSKGSTDDIWRAAHVDEDFQIERWGEDKEAKRRRDLKQHDFNEAHAFWQLAGA
jgi:chaperone required for assembly of F1-ATPase